MQKLTIESRRNGILECVIDITGWTVEQVAAYYEIQRRWFNRDGQMKIRKEVK